MIVDQIDNLAVRYHNTGNSDKIWGSFSHGNIWWAFWGGRGKALTFKCHHEWEHEITKLHHSKSRKGYELITAALWDQLDPSWRTTFSERFTYQLLITET
jgi:hypothetical protein